MDKAAENLRFILWKQNPDRRTWVDRVVAWARCDIVRAEELLRGGAPRREEVAGIARGAGIAVRDLKEKDLLKAHNIDVLLENLRHLVNGLERGEKKRFAREVGLHPTTISAWLSAKQRPERTNLLVVLRYFRLPAGTDLEREPLFLAPLPVGETQRKKWLKERIDRLDAAGLQELFAALAKLLGTR